jgi:hypothetical protein
MTMPEDPEKRTVLWNCAICGEATPVGEPHTCRLDRRQQRRLNAWRRLQRIARRRTEAERHEPCPDCGGERVAGQGHFCRGRTDRHVPDQIEQLVGELRRAGYKIEKQ